jgi:ribA/ribD-fused uncharacterized protein
MFSYGATKEKDVEDVVVHDNMILFWKAPSCYCQWTPCAFTVNDVTYNCTEQYMMAEKARLFGDEEALEKIMKTTSPSSQKSYGRKVLRFDDEVWSKNCMRIVEEGNYAKFSQNPKFKEELLASGTKILAEASPYDKVWGIGLSAYSPLAYDKKTWKGRNMLGTALMNVRDRLRKEEQDARDATMARLLQKDALNFGAKS